MSDVSTEPLQPNDKPDTKVETITVPPTSSVVDTTTRILKKGDLVRIHAERHEPSLKNHDRGLGRVHRAIPVSESSDGHPFRYVVDFVLGGRINNVERKDLVYTTADAEGMTERRKRNPITVVKEATETVDVKPAPKKKRTGTKTTRNKTVKKGKSTANAKHKRKNGKAETKKTAAKAKEVQKEKKGAVVRDLYESHKRDFEKCLGRLEKQDIYAFFLGDPPPECDEDYGIATDAHGSSAQSQENGVATPVKPAAQPVFPDTPPFNFAVIRKRIAHGRYVLDRVRQHKEWAFSSSHVAPELIHPKGVDWDQFRDDVVQMCDAAIARDPQGMNGGTGTLGNAAKKIKDNVLKMYEQNGRRQMKETENDEARHKFYNAIQSMANNEAAMQGKWRRTAFPERIYERLSSDVICAGLSSLDERTAVYELQTSLPDSFVGLSYTYTDTGQSEGWMKSVLDNTMGSDNAAQERKAAIDLANDDGVVRAQVQATMTSLLIGVQDRVMTDAGVLKDNELKSANWAGDVDDVHGAEGDSPDIVEQPVWGIDCYTRRNITACIEKDFDSTIALKFIEKWLLPAINACPVALAHNMMNAARILEGLSLPCSTDLEQEHADDSGDDRWSHSLLGMALKEKMKKSGPVWLKSVAHQLRLAISTLGHDFFRVHPKGHGAIVLQPKLKANTLVTFYRGEVYPSWRWGEKMDAIELTQTRLGLRPNLPDFYNMALERPQVDPRGYGLLFVDASRKAGHGSSLSHSCEPTCEVRVAAVDGQLCLAMTTIRELELGEEVTFDYNAVTESLNEYRSAVCLCGHGRCRGSFLHFATADCYQEVLNRNLPIAVRFSNIIKGCTKQVMSEADEGLLSTHGFGTAAFGAVSFKRSLSDSDASRRALDSMENVPIWLRTYVADTIRYIEYERRALPVMLLCNHLKRAEGEGGPRNSLKHGRDDGKTHDANPSKKQKRPPMNKDESRPIAGSKPEPVFLFFARKQSDFFRSQLHRHGLTDLKGIELQRATMKVASSCWKALSDEMKQHWKEQSLLDWEKNGGQKKARLEAERLKSMKAKSKRREPTDASTDGADTSRKKKKSTIEKEANVIVYPSNLSFQAADAEGMSAMEQRIQQLTQTLSRVGRVLDRHRESGMRIASLNGALSDSTESIHPPLVSLSDDDVVYWLWWHDNGPVRSLLRACSTGKCVSPSLLDALKATEGKYSALLKPDEQAASTASQTSRTNVMEALLELRQQLCNGLLMVEGEMRQHELERSRHKAKIRRDASKKKEEDMLLLLKDDTSVRETVSSVLDWIVDSVVERVGKSQAPNEEDTEREASKPVAKDSSSEDAFEAKPWLEYYADRWKLEASADLLLFYAYTKTFFAIKPYTPLESTPIEVYARELGNAVPRSVIETAHEDSSRASNDDVVLVGTKGTNKDDQVAGIALADAQVEELKETSETVGSDISEQRKSKSKSRALCKPDDIITNVTITYHGDYVLSQLLQWYNGGIGQKPGLPNLTGCVSLPYMSDPWHGRVSGKSGKKQPTRYASEVRPILLDWLTDQRKRGSPFEGQLSQAFPGHDLGQAWNDPKFPSAPIGSPVLDLLVTGDDSSIRNIALALSETIRSTGAANDVPEDRNTGSATEILESTVDEGMPAQGISHWVQCEHPNCLKWRKLPWHVDVDALPETFYCSDNKWNPAASTCDASEDKWDEYDSQLKNEGIVKESDAGMVATESNEVDMSFARDKATSNPTIDVKQFVIGARFDVLRTGKDYFTTGEVVNIDFSSSVKRVLFHFPKTKAVHDEWIEIESPRIAPLLTKQNADKSMRRTKKSGKKAAPTSDRNGVALKDTIDKPKPLDNVEQNGAEKRELSKNAPSQAPLLQGLSWSATSNTLGINSQVKSSPLVAGSRPACGTNSTVYSDGRLPIQLATGHQRSPVRPLVAQRRQTSPLKTPGENASRHVEKNDKTTETEASASSATYTIPRKATVQGGAESLVERIPRKIVSSQSVALTNGASLLLGMTASAISRNALASNYFPPNLPDPSYQARAMQGQRYPPLPSQYFDARNYWQGQHQVPRQSDGSQSKKQHDDRR